MDVKVFPVPRKPVPLDERRVLAESKGLLKELLEGWGNRGGSGADRPPPRL
jgi:hypothetical protein